MRHDLSFYAKAFSGSILEYLLKAVYFALIVFFQHIVDRTSGNEKIKEDIAILL